MPPLTRPAQHRPGGGQVRVTNGLPFIYLYPGGRKWRRAALLSPGRRPSSACCRGHVSGHGCGHRSSFMNSFFHFFLPCAPASILSPSGSPVRYGNFGKLENVQDQLYHRHALDTRGDRDVSCRNTVAILSQYSGRLCILSHVLTLQSSLVVLHSY